MVKWRPKRIEESEESIVAESLCSSTEAEGEGNASSGAKGLCVKDVC